jgi:hypothetical protein
MNSGSIQEEEITIQSVLMFCRRQNEIDKFEFNIDFVLITLRHVNHIVMTN